MRPQMALVPHGGNRRAALAALAAGAVYQRGAARLSDAALRAAYNAATGVGSKFYNSAKENMKRHWNGGRTGAKRARTQSGKGTVARRAGNYRLGGFIGKELKFLDHDASWIGPNHPSNLSNIKWMGTDCISTPAQGDGSSERIGRRFSIKSIQLNGVLRAGSPPDNEAPVATVIANVYIILDRQCNKSNLTTSSPDIVFQDAESKPFINLENVDRFRILKHQRVVVNPTHQSKTPNNNTGYIAWSGNGEKQFEMYVKCDIPVLCSPGNANGGAQSTMNNAVYACVALNRAGNQSTMAPSLSAKTRVRFCC